MASTTQLPGELESLATRPTELVNRNYWFPLGLFGIMTLLWAVVASQWDPATSNSWVFWAIGGPLAGIAVSLFFSRQSDDLGVQPKQTWVYPLIGLGIAVGCFASGALAPGDWVYPAILIVVGIGNIAFGFVDRYAQIAIAGAGLSAIGAIAGIGAASGVALALVSGAFMVGAAFLQWFLP